jgi:hypothetical protein
MACLLICSVRVLVFSITLLNPLPTQEECDKIIRYIYFGSSEVSVVIVTFESKSVYYSDFSKKELDNRMSPKYSCGSQNFSCGQNPDR